MREDVIALIEHADERALRMVRALLEADIENEKNSFSLTPEQEAILDESMELHRKGLMTYSSWDEVKARIISSRKQTANDT